MPRHMFTASGICIVHKAVSYFMNPWCQPIKERVFCHNSVVMSLSNCPQRSILDTVLTEEASAIKVHLSRFLCDRGRCANTFSCLHVIFSLGCEAEDSSECAGNVAGVSYMM